MTKKILTTNSGAPVADDNNSVSAGARGPLTFDNFQLFEKLSRFNRERIPERVVHARGTGAYGTFTLSRSLREHTIASFLQVEAQTTDVFVRFSTVGGGQDSSDYARDPRGFAIKFYTAEGNFDLVGNNTPVFFLNDAMKFPDFVHSQKKNPRTNLADPAAMYEFWANHPQSLHQLTILMSDRGIPLSWRHINGYGSHTFSLWNIKGDRVWVKWHLKTNQGIKTVTNEQAATMSPSGAQEDLVSAIDKGDFPSWTVKVQLLSEREASELAFNPFDVTKVWPHALAPLIEIGQLELNRNVENYFAETEQSAFAPSNLVPGIGPSPDKMLQARLIAYQDAQNYRLGANKNQVAVNAPRCPMHHHQQDGALVRPLSEGGNFFPSDRADSARPASDKAAPGLALRGDVEVKAYCQDDEDYHSQAGELFRVMTEGQKEQLFGNIAGGLSQASASVQERMLQQFLRADPDYAAGIRKLLG